MSTPVPEDKVAALQELLFRGRKLEAIKLYRELTGFGLKQSKEEVERLESSLRQTSPEKFSAPAGGRGCLGAAAVFCFCFAALAAWLAEV
jgi:hypothetical protein